MPRTALEEQFRQLFPEVNSGNSNVFSRAPGRVNLIGEHTDYNDGYVCPMAIERETGILCVPRKDQRVRLYSVAAKELVEFPIDREVPREGPAWALYAKGAVEAVRRRVPLSRGFDAVADTTVPLGGGLSSSASFEVATAMAVLAINGRTLPLPEVALACQWAEHHYPGMPSGIMDQFICAMGKKGHAMLLDCRDQSTRDVPLDDPDLRVVISNSNVKHALVGGEYRARRQQCEAAAAYFQKDDPSVKALRDVSLRHVEEARGHLDPVLYRRAHHVVTEIDRTEKFADALDAREYAHCGKLMVASHESLRNDYEVSCPELDALVEIATQVPGVYGARMTGGGFGGCIVALSRSATVEPLTRAIESEYPKRFPGRKATTFSTGAAAGASVE